MNLKAYAILKELGLRIPCRHDLDAVLTRSPDDRFFVRFDSRCKELSRVMTVGEIQSNHSTLCEGALSGDLLYIEEVLLPLLGGASLCRRGFAYSELVAKHPVTLLRRGLCGGRALQSGCETFVEPVFQGWVAELTTTYNWQPARGASAVYLTPALESLADELPMHIHRPVLIEWMFTKSGLVFCDARDDGLEEFGEALADLPQGKEIVVQDSESPKASRQIDGFDVDHREPPEDHSTITACNGALLSHYSTRCRRRAVRITLETRCETHPHADV